MNKKEISDITKKLKVFSNIPTLADMDHREKNRLEIISVVEKNPQIVEDFLNSYLALDLSEETLNNLSHFTSIIAYEKSLNKILSEKNISFYNALQFLFGPYLDIGIKLNEWTELADKSWGLLRNYNNGQIKSFKDLENNYQTHWDKCCQLIQSLREHPIYGLKIRAKDTGYT